jgi:hypothetical protein
VSHPAIDARALVDDERYPAYRASLVEKRDKLEAALHAKQNALLRGHPPEHAVMCRIAGQIAGLEYALGLPEVLLASDPTSEDLPTP